MFDSQDHLGEAAAAKKAAKQAIKDRRLDDAWRLLHEQQDHYLRHASRQGFTRRQTLALAGSIHEDLANILRLEGRHDQALASIMYLAATTTPPAPKAIKKKLETYFARCKFKRTGKDKLTLFMRALRGDPDLRAAQAVVEEWRSGE